MVSDESAIKWPSTGHVRNTKLDYVVMRRRLVKCCAQVERGWYTCYC